MNVPSPSDLSYFVEVARSGHLTKSSIKIGITQPSLSIAIQRLERVIGRKLFLRSRNGLMLTDAGRTLLNHVGALEECWDRLVQKTKDFDENFDGLISIGCHAEVAIDSLPLFVPTLLQDHPKLNIKIHNGLSRVITEKVISSEIDIGIVVNPISFPDLVIKRLSIDRMTLWKGPGKHETQNLAGGNAVIICDTKLSQTQKFLHAFKSKGYSYGRLIDVSDMEVIVSLVAAGAGIGFLPAEVAKRNKSLNLSRITGVGEINDKICLIYRPEKRSSHAMRAIIGLIEETHKSKYAGRGD